MTGVPRFGSFWLNSSVNTADNRVERTLRD
jgi:hypothetical protein